MSEMSETRDSQYMHRALLQAERGRGKTSPNPMVGCVVVRRGEIVGLGHHRKAGGRHAEVLALRQAALAAKGATVYVNLEPCSHVGRTGPCTQALIEAGVRRVVVATRDANPMVNGKGLRALRRAGIEVETGLLAKEARRLNEAFLHSMAHRRPFVVAKIAQSIDGCVATRIGESQWITGKAARAAGHALRGDLDGIVVGVGTVLADDPQLTCRVAKGRDPVRIVLDSRARTPVDARLIRAAKESNAPTWIVVGAKAPKARVEALQRAGAEVITVPTKRARIQLPALLTTLAERQLLSLLVEGGPTLLGSFVDAGLVDKVHAFVAPILIGGEAAKASVAGKGAAQLVDASRLRDLSVQKLGQDLHITGYTDRR